MAIRVPARVAGHAHDRRAAAPQVQPEEAVFFLPGSEELLKKTLAGGSHARLGGERAEFLRENETVYMVMADHLETRPAGR